MNIRTSPATATVLLLAVVAVLTLPACSVRVNDPAPSPPPGAAAQATPTTNTLDRTSSFLAEREAPIERLGQSLRTVAEYDPHMKWDDAFIKQTVTEASLLKEGDKLEGPMIAKFGPNSFEVKLVIVRTSENKAALRVVTSNKAFADNLAAKFQNLD